LGSSRGSGSACLTNGAVQVIGRTERALLDEGIAVCFLDTPDDKTTKVVMLNR